MEKFNEKEKSLSLADVLEILRGGLVWIIVITLLCTIIGGVYAFFVKETTYQASLKAFIYTATYKNSENEDVEISEMTSFQYGALLAPECPSVFLSDEIMSGIEKKGVVLKGLIEFHIVEDSAMFTVTYTYSQHGGDVEAIRKEVAETLRSYIRESKRIIDAEENKEKYRYFSNKITVSSEPTEKSVAVSTGRLKVILLSMLLGLVVSVIFVLIKNLLDDTINSREQIEVITGGQVIAVVDISCNVENQENKQEVKATQKEKK